MPFITQIKSQIRQILLFRDIFPVQKLFSGMLTLPFEYFGNSGRAGLPWVINLLVTSRCNLRCEMCSFDASKFCLEAEELSADQITDFISYASKKKFNIFLSGGEPFLREDIFTIMESIKKRALTFGICTNGTLLNEKKLELLCKNSPEFIIFSLLGDKEVHDSITGVPGSFETLVANIKVLVSMRHKIKIFINCPITQHNIHQLPEIAAIADKLKIYMLRFEHLNFITSQEEQAHFLECQKSFPVDNYRGLSTYRRFTPGANHFFDAISRMRAMQNSFKTPVHFKPSLEDSEIRSWYSNNCISKRQCFFIWRSLFILPNGDVVPCQFMVHKMGSIKDDNLDVIWNNQRFRDFRLRLKRRLLPGCARCCKL
ncbi:MAG: radical SAM protein [Candidatus Omnitrophica bacterium]|nr:radical SAM protein [Candidatus Omnitrophota bacterium]